MESFELVFGCGTPKALSNEIRTRENLDSELFKRTDLNIGDIDSIINWRGIDELVAS